jgi:pimeloyl-ACP methyl ester carboxylesterase
MAYMDIKPPSPNGETVVLLHGRKFCSATWDTTIRTLSEAGYRVIAPDQIGFCKSSKPGNDRTPADRSALSRRHFTLKSGATVWGVMV